jgi:GTP-binding protein Era
MKSGFVALVGRPNVGKSTLINTLIGKKVVIISDKPQTTRNSIRCIYNDNDSQIIFFDTPGIHKPERKIGEIMNQSAIFSVKNSDINVFIVDSKMAEKTKGIIPGDIYVLDALNDIDIPSILVFNKIDSIINPEEFKKIEKLYTNKLNPKKFLEISALTGKNQNKFIEILKNYLPEGPRFYPEDMSVDRPIEFQISEIIREKAFNYLKEEIPHKIATKIDRIEDDLKTVKIFALIFVERDSHKKIIIGSNGKMIKKIGTSAREELEFILRRKIYLELRVKVKKNWTNNLDMLYYDFNYKMELGQQ